MRMLRASLLTALVILPTFYGYDSLRAEKTRATTPTTTEGAKSETSTKNQKGHDIAAEQKSDELAKIAEMVFKSTEEKYKASQDLWDTATKILTGIVSLGVMLISIAAILGYRDIKDIRSQLPQMEAIRNRTLDSLKVHEEEAKKIAHALRASVSALRETTIAFRLGGEAIDLAVEAKRANISEEEKLNKRQLALNKIHRAERLVKIALTEEDEIFKRGDKSVLGWAYQIWGFTTGEANRLSGRNTLEGYQKALSLIEKGLETAPDQSAGWYNAACYASLSNQVEKAVKHLQESIKLDSYSAIDAAQDDDFGNCRGDLEFETITRPGRVHQG